MENGRTNPIESPDSLRRRVDDAKLRLDFASQYVKEIDSDYRSGLTQFAYPKDREHAMQVMRSACTEYLRVLKIYDDFITRGKAAHNGVGPQAQRESAGAQPYGEEP